MKNPNPAHCPLCGRPNGCRMAAGAHSNEECWCFHMRFPAALLAQVPEHARQRACVCQRCWSEATQEHAPSEGRPIQHVYP